ncbi:M15 family metallopeptidase [Nocardioides sp. CFH 31398]|uniref:M15 family metallopeptidase n=1 Tax=Nocardioides sp. CFH 31398 TaxID=2919579 RepID=UPI001F070C86|nr:M15 family metallopeptidase [Nocardioides sp. CFH 31398]MCH1865408.1 M15 family metallopeptidase [Nocardioides sp. CFH 31398]
MRRTAILLATATLLLAACAPSGDDAAPATEPEPPRSSQSPQSSESPQSPRSSESAQPPEPGSTPPPWLGTRVLPDRGDGFGEVRATPPALRERAFTVADTLPPLPGGGFAARVADPAPTGVLDRSTWAPGCPVAADDLAWVRVTFRGFDGERHTGELLLASEWARPMVRVFRALWDADFPLEELRITRPAELDAPPTGDGNNSGAFVCRPVTGGTSYSEHAYGRAIDLNPFQNPYERDDLVVPELASAWLDRDRDLPGMIRPGDAVVRAFARIGWQWGGDYTSLKDYQHFSSTGG